MRFETKADIVPENAAATDAATDTQADALAAVTADVAALKARMEVLTTREARLPLDGVKGAGDPARTAFVERYLRRGIDTGIEMKSINGAAGADGGFAVPRETDAMIDSLLADISPIRAIANVVQTGTAGYRKLVARGGFASGWVSEVAARPETATPKFEEIVPPMGDLYANPAATQAMLDDAAFDVESWLADEVAREFARAEGAAFIAGSGVNQPRGFTNYPTAATGDATRPFGTLEHLLTGVAGDFGADAATQLITLVHALRPAYRQGACFVMASNILARIRRLKTSDGAFLWQPSLAEGQPATLLGYPVIEAEDMPELSAGSLSLAFGNFRAGYLIADRGETSVLRDPYSNKPFVHFYASKRVGGAVVNSDAIKLLKFGTA